MFRSGGYGQLICDGPQIARDRTGRVVDREHDTFTCRHCNAAVIVNAGEKAADLGGFCRRCMSLICGPCVDADHCRPIEEWLQQQERSIERAIERQRTLHSYG